jgi:hypothetical protein
MKTAAVFGGAKNETNSKEYLDSVLLGQILATNGFRVKTGGYYGIMEAVSKGVFENGGTAIGHTCKTFKTTKGNKYLTETIPSNNIYERLEMLIEYTDIFILQKGGIGTLSELFLTLDVVRKLENKPKILLIGEFWKDMMKSVSQFLNNGEENLYEVIYDVNDIVKYL